jgi:hypothetical protein
MDSQNETREFLVKLAQEELTYKLEEDESENGAPQTNDAEDSNDKSEEDQQQQQRNPLHRLSNAVTIRRACRKAIAGNYSRGSIL